MQVSLCLFGDSVAKGVVLDNVKNKYIFLKDSFANAFAAATGVAVDNFAKFGCTIVKGLEIASKRADMLKDYDFVVLEFGGNDCNFNWAEIAKAPDAQHLPATPLDEFEASYRSLIEGIRSKGARPLMFNLPPIDSKRFFDWVSKGLNAENILKWLGDVEHIYRWHRGYNDAVCRIAEETGTPLIDIRSSFLNLTDYREFICEDGMHPNLKGHKLIFETIRRYAATMAPEIMA
ncbi:MAG: SGNH/GDSL hydrolase family protein [Clostridiales bacterium]|jgi:lysophospholipase L1-like esterase|nr:SGNH/GDSL hydrolase family protein [Clostridiales bacterium]